MLFFLLFFGSYIFCKSTIICLTGLFKLLIFINRRVKCVFWNFSGVGRRTIKLFRLRYFRKVGDFSGVGRRTIRLFRLRYFRKVGDFSGVGRRTIRLFRLRYFRKVGDFSGVGRRTIRLFRLRYFRKVGDFSGVGSQVHRTCSHLEHVLAAVLVCPV